MTDVRFIDGPEREDLLGWYESHRDSHGSKCNYVVSSSDPRGFSARQLAYYLYFRDCFFTGERLPTDDGYVRTLLTDLVNVRRDPDTVMGLLESVRRCSMDGEEGYPSEQTAADYMADYALVRGLPLPRLHLGALAPVLLCETLLPALEPLTPGTMLLIRERVSKGSRVNQEVLDLFNASLPHVDAFLRGSTGLGLAGMFFTGRTVRVQAVFSDGPGLPISLRERWVSVDYDAPSYQLSVFLESMYRYCGRLLGKGGKRPLPVSSVFGKGPRKVVDNVFNGALPRGDYPRKDGFCTVRRPTEAMLLIHRGERLYVWSPEELDEALAEYHGLRSSGPCPFVFSGTEFADPLQAPEEVRRYYLYWRDRCNEGIYGMTDVRYLLFYQYEVAAFDDKDTALGRLAGIAKAYGAYGENHEEYKSFSLASGAYQIYALLKCDRIPDPSVRPSIVSACDMMEAVLEGRDVPVCAANLLILCNEERFKRGLNHDAGLFDENCARIVTRVLRRMGTEGDLTPDMFPRSSVADIVFFYGVFSIIPFKMTELPTRTYVEFSEDWNFRGLLSDLMVAVTRTYLGLKMDIYGFDDFDEELEYVEEEVRAFRAERAVAVAKEIEIDPGMVERAASELEEVTRMMNVPEDGAEREAAAVPVRPGPSGSWTDLFGRLGKTQTDYLRKALSGKAKINRKTEETINSAALETVGDTVVEDGVIPEEYLEDLRKVLRRSCKFTF